MKLGLLGFGEVGYTFAKGIRANSVPECQINAFDINSTGWQGELLLKRSQETNVQLVQSLNQLAKISDAILGLIPASACIKVAWQLADSLQPNQIYCDLSASSPHMKREASEMVNHARGSYLDGSIMGSMVTYGFNAPIYLSGPNAGSFSEKLNSIGFQTRVIGNEAGAASAVKLLRSIFTKGLEALLIETFYSARLFKAEDIVLETLADTFDQETFRETVNRYLTSSVVHADRRVVEVGNVIELLREGGIEPFMALGSHQRLTWMAKQGLRQTFQGIAPEDFHQVLTALATKPLGS